METEIQLPAGISLIPAIRKSSEDSENDAERSSSDKISISDCSFNTDVSTADDLKLSPIKNVHKRKHVESKKPNKKMKVTTDENELNEYDNSNDSDETSESESDADNHDKSMELESSKDSVQDNSDDVRNIDKVLQEASMDSNKDLNELTILKNELSICPAIVDIKLENKETIDNNDEEPKSNLGSEIEKSNDDLEFDITEKLREMGEISVAPVKKGFGDSETAKRKNDSAEDEVSVQIASKSADGDDDEQSSAERKLGNLRRNIREVMDDQQLDAATLSAQREEMERLARVQEQQRIIREVQRQIALNRQNNKTQTRVLSLLQGNTSLLKQNSSSSAQRVSIPGTGSVLVKIPNKGVPKTGTNLTPSISIAPVKPSAKAVSGESSESEPEVDIKPTIPIPKKIKKDVVTIVDSSSDDDCILLSDDEEPEEEPEEDTQNSGLHVNDAYNTPDEQGRVVINIGHPEGDSDIFLAPQIARVIKPHQIGGVRFLFDNIIESVERFSSSTGFGCILAHSMGLGKTLQLVCFCDIFLRHTTSKTVLCIMPINTLQNWMAEFNMWLPTDAENSPLKIHGEVRPRNFNLHVLNDSHKTLAARAKVIQDWTRDGGVLLIGYELYRLLSLKKMSKPKKRRGKNQAALPDDPEDIESNKKLLDEMFEALVKPGPDLVICDEGHRIKNSHAGISMALKQIRSKRRIVLTGYPLQNNLQEYWCMVDFVRPNYLGTKTEFSNMFERPIQNGQCIDSTPQDIRLMRYRAHVLHSLLLGFVQRRSHAVLQTSLPQKEEYVLMLRMTPFQRKLYDTFMNDVVRKKAVPNALKAFAVCCKIWNHPDVLYHWLRKREADLDLDLEDGSTEAIANTSTSYAPTKNKKGGGRARNGASGRVSKKDKKASSKFDNGAIATENTSGQETKPSATIIPNSTGSGTSTDTISNDTNSKFFMTGTNPDNSDNAMTFSNMPNERNNMDFSTTPQSDSNYTYQYPYSQNPYYPPKDEYRPSSYMPNQTQFPTENYNPYPQQQNSDNSYGANAHYWGQNYYMNQNTEFNYSGYPNNIYNSNTYENRYPAFDNNSKTTDNKNWEMKMNDNVKQEEDKEWNAEKQDIKKNEIKATDTNCDTNMQSSDKNNILELQATSADAKKDESLDSKSETEIKLPDDLGDAKPIIVNESIADKTLEELDLQAVKLPVKDEGIPYDWAVELLKGYVDGVIGNSAKMEIFFCILEESVKLNDRILVFSQSLFTLNLIEDFLQKSYVTGTDAKWVKNVNYYRLDGSTSALEREKLINEFNANPNIHMFLVSTRAGSLGINLVGANRVIVFDASWNPCHDTQAVCRVYRYGQKKPCFVYRLVMDNCLERKIYDRQINKQGMADRVVDECNPDAHLSMKEVTNLCWDDELDSEVSDFSHAKDKYIDVVMQKVVESHSHALNKEPFQHESLLIDRKEKKLSQAEKRLAQRGYELEKQASSRPTYSYSSGSGMQYRTIRTPDGAIVHRPVASVRPMQSDMPDRTGVPRPGGARPTRWIPAEVWQRQGMTAQEMTLPLDVVIPTSSTEKSNIVLKAGQKVMVLKSPKGIYMQLESGKIIAIRTAFKVGQGNKGRGEVTQDTMTIGGGIKKSMVRGNMSKFQNNVVPNLTGSMKNTSIIHSKNAQRMNANKGNVNPMFNRKDNSKFNLQNAKSSAMGKNIQFATAKPYNVARNKLQVTSTMKSIGQTPPLTKPSNIKSIEIDTNEICNSKEEESTSKPDSISLDEEQSKESFTSNEISECRKESSPVDSQMDCGDSVSNFESVLCSDEQDARNDLISDDISKLKLDAEADRSESSENEKNIPKLMPQDSPQTPKEVNNDFQTEEDSTVIGIKEDNRDKSTENDFDKPTNKQKTSLKNYRHKSSHKQTLVVPIISNTDSLPAESSLSQLEKTTSLVSDSNNRFQSSLSEITRSITPKDDEKLSEENINRNMINGDVDTPCNSGRSLHSSSASSEENQLSGNNYTNNLQFDNNKQAINVDNKKESDLLGIGSLNFPNTDNYVKNNTIQESQDTSKAESKQTPIVQQQLHHFAGYGHSETGITPSQPYPPPYAGYSYPANCMPPYESIYPAHTTQYHDPASYTGLFHGHSAFHRPEPMPVTGQDINPATNFHHPSVHAYQSPSIPAKPAPYPTLNPTGSTQGYAPQIQNYTPQLPSAQLPSAQLPPTQLPPAQLPPSQISTPQIAPGQIPQITPTQIPSSQASSAQLPSSQIPSSQLPAPLPPAQMPHVQASSSQLPPQPYPAQNPVPNYQLNVPSNGYGNYPGQSIYSQFGGNYAPPPNPQAAYNARSIYPSMEYGTPNYPAGYSPYPGQHANNQWAQ